MEMIRLLFAGEQKTQKVELFLTREKLVVLSQSFKDEYLVSNITDSKVVPFVGGGSFECLIQGQWKLICKFENTYIDAFGELVKFLNHFIETKEFDYENFKGVSYCPKCGKILPQGVKICPHCSTTKVLLKNYFAFLKPHRIKIAFSIFAVFIFVLCRTIWPVYTSNFIDKQIANGGITSIDEILVYLATTVCLLLISLLFDQISEQSMMRVNLNLSAELKNLCFEKIQQISLNSFSTKDTGEYFNIVNSSTKVVRKFTRTIILSFLSNVFRMLIVIVIMFVYSPILALIAVVPFPILLLAMASYYTRMEKFYRKQSRAAIKETQVIHDLVSGIRVVKAFGNEKQSIQYFEQASRNLMEVCKKNEVKWVSMFAIFYAILAIIDVAILVIAGTWVLNGTLSLGTLLLFVMMLPKFFRTIRRMSGTLRDYQAFKVEFSKILGLLSVENEIVFTKGNEYPAIRGEIEFRNVSFGYKSYDLVLKNISFTVKPGEMLGLVGHSGAGKSTIINLLLRLYDVTSGEILIDGVPINQIPKTFLQKSYGTVFQERYLFNDTIMNNVKYTFPTATREQVIAACKEANIHNQIASLPLGYETLVGEKGCNLSGGEKQRLVIARAILPSPNILILDEATSALDVESEKTVQDAFASVSKNKTTIAIAHRLTTLKNATKLIVLRKGEIIEQGTHEELMAIPNGEYALLVEAQKNMGLTVATKDKN